MVSVEGTLSEYADPKKAVPDDLRRGRKLKGRPFAVNRKVC